MNQHAAIDIQRDAGAVSPQLAGEEKQRLSARWRARASASYTAPAGYTAPATYKGPVYLSASTEFLTSSLILQVNCNITQPSAPPISAAPGGTAIQPPRTGDGGLMDDNAGGLPVALVAAAVAASGGLLLAGRRLSRTR